ncbi:hypothetical protein [Polyangium aurulentum]|uniref:hypothetical protein n=1 Tax=Polyangium aurulentum TaxID=2567896 RepID=UPI00146F4333|nr:hypothetical protein [Polyangium aurulentum]UQA61860.1 hypothetical protein E8A73_015855 [Polyangium aurulentum]
MKYRFGISVLALGLGVASNAAAQPPAAPPPAPPPPAAAPADPAAPAPTDAAAEDAAPTPPPPPPTTNPNAPPAPPAAGDVDSTPPAPPPVTLPPYLSGSTTAPLNVPGAAQTPAPTPPGPGADAGVAVGKAPARVRWRGTNVSWNHSLNTQMLGIGSDYQSTAHHDYTQSFALALNYFLIERKDEKGNDRGHSLRVTSSLGFDVELTDGFTTTKREPLFRDVPLSFVYSRPLWKSANDEWSLSTALNGTLQFPTSKLSYNRGIFLSTSPRASLFLQFPIRGKDAPFLKGALAGLAMRWDHRFSRATVPTNPDLERPRQTMLGSSFIDDIVSPAPIDVNTFRPSAFVFFDEHVFDRPLWVFLSGGLNYRPTPRAGGSRDCYEAATGCGEIGRLDNAADFVLTTAFSVGLTYFPMVEWGISLGYDNVSGQLGEDGQTQNPFYSPNAQFSANLVVSIDAIYERLTGPERDDPFIVFGKNQPRKAPTAPPQGPGIMF